MKTTCDERNSSLRAVTHALAFGVALVVGCSSPSSADSAESAGSAAPGDAVGAGSDVVDDGGGASTGDAADASHETPSSTEVALRGLSVTGGTLVPAFDPGTRAYAITTSAATLGTPLAFVPRYDCDCEVTINGGAALGSGATSLPIARGLVTPLAIDIAIRSRSAGASAPVHYAIASGPIQEAYVKPAVNATYAQFGDAVALSGSTMAVGAHAQNAVDVYERSGATWSLEAHLPAPAPAQAGQSYVFGKSVALAGDTLAVGAPSGAVYVFARSGAQWSLQATLTGSRTTLQANSSFGSALALSGDTLVIGASSSDSNSNGVDTPPDGTFKTLAGAVYVFTRTGAVWTQQAFIQASNNKTMTSPLYFGQSVAIAGDTLAVGASGEASGATGINGNQSDRSLADAGAAYVFTRAAGVWSQQAYVKASNTRTGAKFGGAVALVGDTLAVGAAAETSGASGINGNQADVSASGAGAVYVFKRTAATWAQQSYVKPSNTRAAAAFGTAVALAGGVLVVGAPGESSDAVGVGGDPARSIAPGAGAVYLFDGSGTSWTQHAYVKASNARTGSRFGTSVAFSVDSLAVGSPLDASSATGINGDEAQSPLGQYGAVHVLR